MGPWVNICKPKSLLVKNFNLKRCPSHFYKSIFCSKRLFFYSHHPTLQRSIHPRPPSTLGVVFFYGPGSSSQILPRDETVYSVQYWHRCTVYTCTVVHQKYAARSNEWVRVLLASRYRISNLIKKYHLV